jgi:hypothetical protein
MARSSPAVLTDKFILEKLRQFEQALGDAIEVSETMVSEEEASPFDGQTFNYAVSVLAPLFIEMEIPAPLVLPLQNGGIGAEWHAFGMNIELRFRNPYHVYAVIEDVQLTIPRFHGRDSNLVRARKALAKLAARATL